MFVPATVMYERCSRHPGDAGYRFLKALSLEIREPMGEVVESDEGIRGDTASNVTKPALLETGKSINVPLFIKEGETIKIDRVALGASCRRNQLVGHAAIELEAGFDQAVQLAFLDGRRLAVERDDVDQQRGCSEAIIGLVKGPRLRVRRNDIGDELAKSVQHPFSLSK